MRGVLRGVLVRSLRGKDTRVNFLGRIGLAKVGDMMKWEIWRNILSEKKSISGGTMNLRGNQSSNSSGAAQDIRKSMNL